LFQSITWESVITSGSILKGQFDIAVQNAVAFSIDNLVVGTPFNLFPITANWSPFGMSITKGAGLSSGGAATLRIGIDLAPFEDCILGATILGTVNSVTRNTVTAGLSTASGWITAEALLFTINAGSFLVRVSGQQMGY
jgi:hypothetical protein